MNIHIGIDPDIAKIGPLLLTWHGLFTALGILVAVWLTARELRRRGIALPNYDTWALVTVFGGILGARLFFVLDHIDYFIGHPLEALAVNEGGLAIYGAVFGGFVAIVMLSRIFRQPLAPLLDSVVPGLLLAQAIGRLGCTVNGDAWGGPCLHGCPITFTYTNPKDLLPADLLGVPTHPYPLYDIVVNLIVFAIIWRLRRRPVPAGTLAATYAVLYSFGRFFISFVRQERIWFWGLQEAQVVAVLAFVAGLVALAVLFRGQRHVPTPAEA